MKARLKSIGETLNHVYYILTPQQRVYAVIVFFASLLGALLEMLGVTVIYPLVSVVSEPDVVYESEIGQMLIQSLAIESTGEILVWLCTGIIAIYIVKNLYFLFLSWLRIKFSFKIHRELSLRVMHSYMHRPYDHVISKTTAEMIREITYDTERLYAVVLMGFRLLTEFLTITLIAVSIFIVDWIIASWLLALAVICLLFIVLFFRKKVYEGGRESLVASSDNSQVLLSAFYGIKEVFVMRKQSFYEEQYEKTFLRRQQATIVVNLAQESPAYLIEGICVTGIMLYILLQSLTSPNINSIMPLLSFVAVGAFRLLPSLGRISSMVNNIIANAPAVQTVYDNLKTLNAFEKDELGVVNSGLEKSKTDFNDSVQLRGIYWKYPEAKETVLENVDLDIKKGESVGIVGASGAGKSTLSDIILGLHSLEKGQVLVDGIDIRQIPESWSRLIGYVPQSLYLINGTIRENVAFGEAKEKIDDQKIWNALEQAQLKTYVSDLPDGINTIVGERGVRLSGGQQQRIAIARALYRQPQILVLDEATSALDTDTETAVMEAVEHLQGKITMIIITHRVLTLRKCDKIYEVSGGALEARDYNRLIRM